VQRVPDLVDGQRLGLSQPALGVEGLLLEEAAHLVRRVEERPVGGAHLVAGGEDAAVGFGIERIDNFPPLDAEQRRSRRPT